MNFILKTKLAYLCTEKKRLIYMHLLLLYYVAYQDLKKEENWFFQDL